MLKFQGRTSRAAMSRQLTVIGLVAVLTFMLVAFLMCLVAMFGLKSHYADLQNQKAELERTVSEQAAELKRKGDPDYIKKYARENLGLQEEGEEQFVPE